MGDIEAELVFEQEFGELDTYYKTKELYWEPKNGDSVLVQDMQDSHIENCIKWLTEYHTGGAWIEIFKIELEKRKQINNMTQDENNLEQTEVAVVQEEQIPENLNQGLTKLEGFQNVEEMVKYAEILIKGRLIPTHFRTPEAVVSAIQMGRELGIGAMTALNGIIPINGLPTLKANLQSALVNRSGIISKTLKDFAPIYSNGTNTPDAPKTNEKGELVKDRPVDYETVIRFYKKWNGIVIEDDVTFKWSMAIAAGWASKDNWKKMPTQMMWSRCYTTGARRNASHALNNLYETSEIIDSVDSEFTYEIDHEGNMSVKNKK